MRYTQDLSASLHDHYIPLRTKDNWSQEKREKENQEKKIWKDREKGCWSLDGAGKGSERKEGEMVDSAIDFSMT